MVKSRDDKLLRKGFTSFGFNTSNLKEPGSAVLEVQGGSSVDQAVLVRSKNLLVHGKQGGGYTLDELLNHTRTSPWSSMNSTGRGDAVGLSAPKIGRGYVWVCLGDVMRSRDVWVDRGSVRSELRASPPTSDGWR